MADNKTKRTWISIVVGLLIILFVMAAVLIGSAIFYVRRHVRAEFVTTAVGTETFDQARARFAGQQPLIEMREHDAPIIHRRTAVSTAPLQSLNILAFDTRAGKIVRVSVPFWVLRMAPGKRFNLGSNGGIEFDSERTHLTVDDLEQAGPGLLLDGVDPRGQARVLVWTE
jgi:hypothetical protein